MSVSDEVRRDAERTGELVGRKLLEIMDLQGDIDALLRDKHRTPFGSKPWQSDHWATRCGPLSDRRENPVR